MACRAFISWISLFRPYFGQIQILLICGLIVTSAKNKVAFCQQKKCSNEKSEENKSGLEFNLPWKPKCASLCFEILALGPISTSPNWRVLRILTKKITEKHNLTKKITKENYKNQHIPQNNRYHNCAPVIVVTVGHFVNASHKKMKYQKHKTPKAGALSEILPPLLCFYICGRFLPNIVICSVFIWCSKLIFESLSLNLFYIYFVFVSSILSISCCVLCLDIT